MQERTGARIQIPKTDETPSAIDEDDDPLIDIIIEGNEHSVAEAKIEITRIAGERTPKVNTRLRTIPAEFYPFIEERQNENSDVNIQVPQYHTWKAQHPPEVPLKGQRPEFRPAADGNHIILTGDRTAVQAKRAEIEKLAEELQRELTVHQFALNRARHQYIIGNRGISPEEFFKTTGCAIILPSDTDDDQITIIGRPHQTEAAAKRANKLAFDMQSDNISVLSQFRNIQDPSTHVANLAQYLRQRKAIESLEKAHQAHIIIPDHRSGAGGDWQFFSRDPENFGKARSELSSILQAHPPSRIDTVRVDPFFHQHLQQDITPRVKKNFGVHVVTPNPSDVDASTLR